MEWELTDELTRAEGLIVAGLDDEAHDLLKRLVADAEDYVDANCQTTSEVQWFSFPTVFERLCYLRVERDPRRLLDVGEPLDRLYADLALTCVRLGDYDQATEALKRAVRWNPMECGYRLDLADLFLLAGDVRECLALAYSVFERASEASHIVRAYLVFARWFERSGEPRAAAACLAAARRMQVRDAALAQALELAAGTACDPDALGDDEVASELAAQGLPDGANAEVAVCLLMCATDAADAGERELATRLTLRARDLVGEPAAMALVELIREQD